MKIKKNKTKNKLLVILGPTSSGKSDLAVQLAKKFNGEVVSADSRQVYRGMDIGTGKITKKEMQGVPHHLLDVASPKRRFTVAQYQKMANNAIRKIQRKDKLPILCGGTGFYIQSIVDNIVIPPVKPDWKLRKKLDKQTAEQLFKQLKKLDPKRAKNIDRYNKRRLIRAIEIVLKTKKPIPKLSKSQPYNCLMIGIKMSKEKLKQRIEKRLKKRLKQGMIGEIRQLRKSGVSWKRLEEFGLEYRYIAYYLQNKINEQEMIEKLQKKIEHYAKRQMTWFKKHPAPEQARCRASKNIYWIENKKTALGLIKEFLRVRR